MLINTDAFLLVGSILLFASVVAGKVGYRFGVPALLLFLGVGMLFGTDGLGIEFDNARLAQFIGMLALSVILFSGGMDTKFSEIKPVLAPGMVLATVGVVMTAFLTGGFIYLISSLFHFELTFLESLLMAAVMSSTDSASVFSILRSKRQGLKEQLRPLLELESGSNDPMAYITTVLLLNIATAQVAGGVNWWHTVGLFFMQMGIGAAAGYLLGLATVWVINHININNGALYSVLLLAFVFFIFSITDLVGGNGYLAVYIAGLVVGNKKIVFKRTLTTFLDGFTWLFQIVMFLALGLLVNPHQLVVPETVSVGLLVSFFMIIFARPLTVFLCLVAFRRFSFKALLYVSWVGLRGAVPIIFATYPLVAVADGFDPGVADMIFNVVFFITIVSLAIQGSTVGKMAELLGLSQTMPEDSFGIDLPDKIKSALSEFEVNANFLRRGNQLKNIELPDHSLVLMVKRGEEYFVPRGNTKLLEGDKLLLISDNDEELKKEIEQLGIE